MMDTPNPFEPDHDPVAEEMAAMERQFKERIAAARLDAARKVRDRIVAHVTQPRRRVGDDAHMHMCQLVSEVQAMDDAALAKIVGE